MNFTCWKHASPTFANFNFEPEKFNRYTFYRAILENTALVTRGHIDLVKESTGHEPSSVVFGGGASKSPLWCQILADEHGSLRDLADLDIIDAEKFFEDAHLDVCDV